MSFLLAAMMAFSNVPAFAIELEEVEQECTGCEEHPEQEEQIFEEEPVSEEELVFEEEPAFEEETFVEEVELEQESLYASVVASGYCGAEGDGTNLEWTIDSNGKLTISGNGAMKDYSASWAFPTCSAPWGRYSLKTLEIKKGVTTIGDGAFTGIKTITGSLVIPDSIETIGECAFMECSGFTGSIIIPDSVNIIEEYAFAECSGFTGGITIGNGVTEIGKSAFREFQGSGRLSFGGALKTIGDDAFYWCPNLEGSVTFHGDLKTIGSQAFEFCDELSRFYFEGNAPSVTYEGDDGSFREYNTYNPLFIYYPEGNNTWSIRKPSTYGPTYDTWNGYRVESWKGHHYRSNSTKPTCSSRGYTVYTCYDYKCTATYKSAYGEKLDHTKKTINATSPTCTEVGYTQGAKCSVCGEIIVAQTVIPAKGHNFGTWYVEHKPTHEKEGVEHRICRVCGWVDERAIPKNDYVYGDANDDGDVNVIDANLIRMYSAELAELSEREHIAADVDGNGEVNVLDANRIRKYAVKLITTFPAALDKGHTHTPGEWTVAVAQTCVEEGRKVSYCVVCGNDMTETIDSLGGHKYSGKVIVNETCATEGTKEYTCSVCGDSYTETIPATGKHDYSSEIVSEATCKYSGTRRYTCTVCGYSYTESISALGHNYVGASCTTNGKCSRCGEIKYATGHYYEYGKCYYCGGIDPYAYWSEDDLRDMDDYLYAALVDANKAKSYADSAYSTSYSQQISHYYELATGRVSMAEDDLWDAYYMSLQKTDLSAGNYRLSTSIVNALDYCSQISSMWGDTKTDAAELRLEIAKLQMQINQARVVIEEEIARKFG